MEGIFGNNLFNRGGWSFRQFPERFTIFCFRIEGISVEKLHDIVSIKLIEQFGGYFYGVFKVVRPVLDEFCALSKHLNV